MWNASDQSSDMGILDVDEELKDDSFFAMDDRTHDDVCNILKQWQRNWLPPQDKEQAYKLNSKTFTRPKKKLFQQTNIQNNENFSTYQITKHQDGAINLEIGGYVTNMHKSFLQDTSPPASICSSMDMSMEQVNNSLITSADFSNISFLHLPNCLDSIENIINNQGNEKLVKNGYSFDDVIRARKSLDSLTLSADGTLIKDSNIAQIDDISLALSKTASSCSTMDNSTNSVDSTNMYGVGVSNKNSTFDCNNTDNINKTILLNNDMICDTSFNLVQNSFILEKDNVENVLNMTQTIGGNQAIANETFKKQMPLNETICITAGVNSTFDMLPEISGSQCGTPENNNRTENFCISTPHMPKVSSQKQQFTPSINKIEEINISPIVHHNRVLDETYNNPLNYQGSDSFGGVKMDNKPNSTFNKNYQCLNQKNNESNDVPNVLELANAEAELLASNGDEVQFEHMLEELSRVHMSYDQDKMKMSLNNIKKRLNCVIPSESNKNETATDCVMYSSNANGNKNRTSSEKITKDNIVNNSITDRLLSRRSRLYDNINLTNLPDKSNSTVSNIEQDSKSETDTKLENSMNKKISDIDHSLDGNNSSSAHTQMSENNSIPLTRRERDRDRFKTIKIVREHGVNQSNENLKNLPCIDNDGSVMKFNESEIESDKTKNFLTYKKPREEEPTQQVTDKSNVSVDCLTITRPSNTTKSGAQLRSLSRPRYISGLQKFSAVCKATSAGDLDVTVGANTSGNEKFTKTIVPVSGANGKNSDVLSKELKSPMGIKSKSFHNLSMQSGTNSSTMAGFGQKHVQSKLIRPGTKTFSQIANAERMQQNHKTDENVFKVPKTLNKTSHIKSAGLPRPSSGCFSLSIPGKGLIQNTDILDHSGDSMKERNTAETSKNNSVKENKDDLTEKINKTNSKSVKSATGIPKPSGLRPPTIMKRSCLPRPSSITRH